MLLRRSWAHAASPDIVTPNTKVRVSLTIQRREIKSAIAPTSDMIATTLSARMNSPRAPGLKKNPRATKYPPTNSRHSAVAEIADPEPAARVVDAIIQIAVTEAM